MKDVTFTFNGSEDQVLELFDFLRKAGVLCRYVTAKEPTTLVVPVQEVSIEEADTILNKDY